MNDCRVHKTVCWVFQIIAAAILAQTLFFKFTGAEESKYIFSRLGVEPWGRVVTGCAELAAVVLLLLPKTGVLGALLSFGLMMGAIASHLFKLGIVIEDDGGLLFALAVIVLTCCAIVLFLRRGQIPLVGKSLAGKDTLSCSTKICGNKNSIAMVDPSL